MKITPHRAAVLVREAFTPGNSDNVHQLDSWANSLARTLCTWEDNEHSRAVALVYGALIARGNYCAGHRVTLRRAETAVDAVFEHYHLLNKRGPTAVRQAC
jgi:hypothetical protein